MFKSTVVYPLPVFGKNASDCSLNEDLSFGGWRRTDEFEDVADAERNSVKRLREDERSDSPYSFQHFAAAFVSGNPVLEVWSLVMIHFSVSDSDLHHTLSSRAISINLGEEFQI